MSVSNYILSGSKFKKAKNLSTAAQQEEGESADKLFQQAYTNFAMVSSSRAQYPDSLHRWGLAFLHQAQQKSGDEAIQLFEEAITKFTLCDAVKPDHIGAFMDGGVALMGLAKEKGLGIEDDLYIKAQKSFSKAEEINPGTASYNLACIYALQNNTEACKEALKKASDSGIVPSEENILNDSDLDNVKNASWFDDFITSLSIEAEPEPKPVNPYK